MSYLRFHTQPQRKPPEFKVGDRVSAGSWSMGVFGTITEVIASVVRPGTWCYVVSWDDGAVFKRAFAENQLEGEPKK